MKQKTLKIVFIVVGIAFILSPYILGAERFTPNKGEEKKISYDIFDSLTWLFNDSKPGKKPTKVARLLAPCGSISGFQILLEGVPEGTEVSLSRSSLK